MRYLIGLLLLPAFGLTSCFSNKDELTGTIKVKGSEDLYVKIYQQDKFDYVTPITFKVVDNNDLVVFPDNFLAGTDVRHESIERFSAFVHDSILYICYPYPEVFAIQHLDVNKPEVPRDSLFKKLKKHDPKLFDTNK